MELIGKLQAWDRELKVSADLIDKQVVKGCQSAVKENFED
jgi:hypothetical protein